MENWVKSKTDENCLEIKIHTDKMLSTECTLAEKLVAEGKLAWKANYRPFSTSRPYMQYLSTLTLEELMMCVGHYNIVLRLK